MALSQSVTDSLKEAEHNLRNALAYAARQERSTVCADIAKLLANVEHIQRFDELLDTLENLKAEKG